MESVFLYLVLIYKKTVEKELNRSYIIQKTEKSTGVYDNADQTT